MATAAIGKASDGFGFPSGMSCLLIGGAIRGSLAKEPAGCLVHPACSLAQSDQDDALPGQTAPIGLRGPCAGGLSDQAASIIPRSAASSVRVSASSSTDIVSGSMSPR